jgi:hypothetical protein
MYLIHNLSSKEEKEISVLQLEPGRVTDLEFVWKESTCSLNIPAFSGLPG